MITEDYVSFEISKLLKEKGFDCLCHSYFRKDNPNNLVKETCGANWNNTPFFTSRPTLQMAMKWLREVHKIGIFPSTYSFTIGYDTEEYHPYGTAIINLVTYELITNDIMPRNSYEQAAETAIKYCLENLI